MPSRKKWKYLGIGLLGGVVTSIGIAILSVFGLIYLADRPSSSGIILSDIGCPSGMVENLSKGRCEVSDKTMSEITSSFRKHDNHKLLNPLPSSKRLRELAVKTADRKGTFSDYRIAALLGDAESQYHVGKLLSQGRGVEEDDLEALRWLHVAAHNNYLDAQTKLAEMLASGLFVKKDEQLAQVWLKRAEANKNQRTKQVAGLKA